jgi:hypothetical protein
LTYKDLSNTLDETTKQRGKEETRESRKRMKEDTEDPSEKASDRKKKRIGGDDITLNVPSFFVFVGRPVFSSKIMRGSELYQDMENFWLWIKSFSTRNPMIDPPVFKSCGEQVLLFIFLMITCNNAKLSQKIISIYRNYLRVNFKDLIPNLEDRTTFAERMGIHVSGPEEIEETLLSIVRIESGRLRDETPHWMSRMSQSLLKIFDTTISWIDGGEVSADRRLT